MKIIGVGLGRTGTLSLKIALEKLGFSPCYHMLDVFKFPGNAKIWWRVGHENNINWAAMFGEYQAGIDYPFTTHYKDIFSEMPELKVILTVRDPDSWYESAEQTIYKIQYFLRNFLPRGKKVGKTTIWHILFEERFHDRDFAIRAFKRHIDEVKQFVPENQLLVFTVQEGWSPLCQFLGVPVPDEPFPHANQRFVMKWAMVFTLLFVTGIVISLLYFAVKLFIRL